MGTPVFAARVLEDISDSVDIACVYTRKDAIRKRGNKLFPSPVKEVALRLGIEVRTPSTLRGSDEVEHLEGLDLDFIVVAAYGMILPKEILDIPRYGCLNIHASLLPRWRGAAPIERAILEGDTQTGICIMQMEEGLDTGDYCVSRSIPIGEMNSDELTLELAALGSVGLLTALEQISSGNPLWNQQDDDRATYARKIDKHELNLDPVDPAIQNLRRVKASNDAHPAKCDIGDRVITVLDASLVSRDRLAGSNSDVACGKAAYIGKKLLLGCCDGPLEVTKVKPSGKSMMDASAFVSGFQDLRSGEVTWGSVDAE